MSMLKDPEMKEIVDGFCEEARGLLEELEQILEEIEDSPSSSFKFEEFGQKIDRIMGAAKSIDAIKTGKICELGKVLSYKAAQSNDETLNGLVCSSLFDALDIVEKLIESIEAKSEEDGGSISLEAFTGRLKWLSEKFSHIERASVSNGGGGGEVQDQSSIDDLLKDLGV